MAMADVSSNTSSTMLESTTNDEEMSQSINLSHYAHVMVRLNLGDGKSAITIFKKPFNQNEFTSMPLDVAEWKQLNDSIDSLADAANDMAANASAFHADEPRTAVAGDIASHAEPSYPSKLLSTRVIAKLNLFNAPNGQKYVTLAIRPYVIDVKTHCIKLLRDGVTLNLREIAALKDKASIIVNAVHEQMSSTHFMTIGTPRDVELAMAEIEEFFTKSITGQKLRLILEKKDYPFHVAPNVMSAAVSENEMRRRELRGEAQRANHTFTMRREVDELTPEEYEGVLRVRSDAAANALKNDDPAVIAAADAVPPAAERSCSNVERTMEH